MNNTANRKVNATLKGFANLHPFQRKIVRPDYYQDAHFEYIPDFNDEDSNAIAKDWAMVGKDIEEAVEGFSEEFQLKKSA